MHHWSIGLIEDSMIDVSGFEEEVAGPIDNRLVWQNIGHIPRCDLSDARPDMIVLAYIATGGERQLGHAKLIFPI